VCNVGKKGSWGEGAVGFRGNEGLGEVTVYVNPEVSCDIPCDDFNCKEVEQLEAGSCWKDGDRNDDNGAEKDVGVVGYDGLETDGVTSGAVNLPSAGEMMGSIGDYVAGVADAGAIGEAN
jgi:hypothetical protein